VGDGVIGENDEQAFSRSPKDKTASNLKNFLSAEDESNMALVRKDTIAGTKVSKLFRNVINKRERLFPTPGFRGIIGLMSFHRRLSPAKLAVLAAAAIAAVALLRTGEAPAASASSDAPQYAADGRLMLPRDYRGWIYLSSGLGMEYNAEGKPGSEFTNVFVKPSAYRAFLSTGRWPDRTVFVLEIRDSATRGSINRGGHYQSGLRSLAASVKDVKRFPAKWAYFSFNQGARQARANPPTSCFQCHNTHGAVDNTFVQFYPTLKPVAEKYGTYNPSKAASESTKTH
jgi:Cytochrome P460